MQANGKAPRRTLATLADRRAGGGARRAVARRLAGLVLCGCFVATLALSIGHNHYLDGADCQSTACIHCTGALAAGPGAPVLVAAPPLRRVLDGVPEALPALPYLLPLAHSGGAPPRA